MVGTAKRACRAVHTTAKIVGRAVDNCFLPEEESLRTTTQLSMYVGDDDESKLWTDNDGELQFRTSVSEGSRRRRRREWKKRYIPVVIFVALIPTLIGLFLGGGFSPRGPDWKLREQLALIVPGTAHANVASENARNNSSWHERPVSQADFSKQADLSNMHGSAVKKGGEPRIRRRMAATRGDNWGDNWGDNLGDNLGDNWGGNWGGNWNNNWNSNWGDNWGGNWGGNWVDNWGDNWGDNWTPSLAKNELWNGSKSSNKSGKSEDPKSKGSKRGKVRSSHDVVVASVATKQLTDVSNLQCPSAKTMNSMKSQPSTVTGGSSASKSAKSQKNELWSGSKSNKSVKSEGPKSKGSKRGDKVRISQDVVPYVTTQLNQLNVTICSVPPRRRAAA